MTGLDWRKALMHCFIYVTSDMRYRSTAAGLRLEKVYDLGDTSVLDLRRPSIFTRIQRK